MNGDAKADGSSKSEPSRVKMDAAPNWVVKDDIERPLSVFWTVHFHSLRPFSFVPLGRPAFAQITWEEFVSSKSDRDCG